MINIFKNKLINYFIFFLTVFAMFYLLTVILYEYNDSEEVKDFFKSTKVFMKKKLKVNNEIKLYTDNKNNFFSVWTLKLNEYNPDKIETVKKDYQNLLNEGYRVYLKRVNEKYILYVGPEFEINKLKKISSDMLKKHKIKSTIEEYDVGASTDNVQVVL